MTQLTEVTNLFFFFKDLFLFIYDSHTETERGRGRERSRLHAPGARHGIRSQVSRITPWAKGRRQTTAPPRDPSLTLFSIIPSIFIPVVVNGKTSWVLMASQGRGGVTPSAPEASPECLLSTIVLMPPVHTWCPSYPETPRNGCLDP